MLLPKQSRNYVTGLAAACSLLLIACSPEEVRQVNLIPKPEQMTMTEELSRSIVSRYLAGNLPGISKQ